MAKSPYRCTDPELAAVYRAADDLEDGKITPPALLFHFVTATLRLLADSGLADERCENYGSNPAVSEECVDCDDQCLAKFCPPCRAKHLLRLAKRARLLPPGADVTRANIQS